jgi:carbonic anhydrase
LKKLIKGIVEFRKNLRPEYRETFAKLALGQSPDVLYVACSDSRVAVNVFASTDPGDLFVVRNVGNMVPKWEPLERGSAAAALEFAVFQLKVSDIIICGHSECGAMQAIWGGRDKVTSPHLMDWLRHGEDAKALMAKGIPEGKGLAPHNHLSQANVVQQLENLKTHSFVRERIEKGSLKIHGWWFDIAHADVYVHDPSENKFLLVDETQADRMLKGLI